MWRSEKCDRMGALENGTVYALILFGFDNRLPSLSFP